MVDHGGNSGSHGSSPSAPYTEKPEPTCLLTTQALILGDIPLQLLQGLLPLRRHTSIQYVVHMLAKVRHMPLVRHQISTEEIHVVDLGSARATLAPVNVDVGYLWDPAAGEGIGASISFVCGP